MGRELNVCYKFSYLHVFSRLWLVATTTKLRPYDAIEVSLLLLLYYLHDSPIIPNSLFVAASYRSIGLYYSNYRTLENIFLQNLNFLQLSVIKLQVTMYLSCVCPVTLRWPWPLNLRFKYRCAPYVYRREESSAWAGNCTFDCQPESFMLAVMVSAEGDEDGVCVAGDVESNRQVPAASHCQLGTVVNDEYVWPAVRCPLEGRVCCNAHQQSLVALRHKLTNTLDVRRILLWVAWTDDERRTVGDPPRRRANVHCFTSYTTQHNDTNRKVC